MKKNLKNIDVKSERSILMSKLQMIRLKNTNGDDVITIEIIASKQGKMPAFSKPDFNGEGETVLELITDEDEIETFENEDAENKLEELKNNGEIKFNEKTYTNPKIRYEDITEKLILGSKSIKMESLKSQEHGLWSMSGRRKIEIIFDNVDCFIKTSSISQSYIRIVFNKINGEVCEYRDFSTEESKLSGEKAIVEIDTDMFDDAFKNENENKKHVKLGGYIEVICQSEKGKEIRYKYSIELYVINTDPKVCDYVSELPASIDFGTSSTCVAIERNNKNELLTLSPIGDNDGDDEEEVGNIFENPTNIMIYDWEALYAEWKNENASAPIINKGGKNDYLKSINPSEYRYSVDFDSGYSVKAILGSDDIDRKELNAILTLIKMIPYQIIEEKQQLEINPYNNKDKFINVICEVDKQSDTCFNPVAFYGYLIGRAINDISKHDDIYTQFQITSPVMFDDEVKEVLRTSLEYGLSRSVPKKLRDRVEVTITHTEPVAYIGALCGTEYFQIEEDEKKMFAVYDFGGGTLDFSYGIVSNEDELKIEVIKVGGKDNFGGETLIERLAYQIYLYNSVLREKNIPFIQPYGEELPDDVDERLVKKSDYAKANMNIVSAKIARRIFEGKLDGDNEESFKNLELYNMDGEREEVKVNYDVYELEEELREIIIESVNDFAVTLNDAFAKTVDKYDVNDVYIFKAGNSSRSRFVDEGMRNNFPGNKHIQLVDQSTDKRKPKRYSITPKTAVAIGQLKLNRIEVVGDNGFFKYYVGFFNEGTGKFKIILDRSHNDGVWHKFRKVKNDAVDIQYSTSKPSDSSTVTRKMIKTPDEKGKNIFVRIKDETTIEYCFSDFDDVEMIKDSDVKIFDMDLR